MYELTQNLEILKHNCSMTLLMCQMAVVTILRTFNVRCVLIFPSCRG